MSTIIAGFLLGVSLIVAIGPQNALLIKQGIRREGVLAVVIVCALSDILLITAATAGVGVLVDRAPWLLTLLKYGGAAYLAYFGWTCFRDALREEATAMETEPHRTEEVVAFDGSGGGGTALSTRVRMPPRQRPWVKPMLAALAFTWLNPAAYIDTFVMLGGVANQYGDERWLFALGALCASFLWFPSVGYGAAKFSSVLAQPRVWRFINCGIGCIMAGLVFKLLFVG